jgi:hypothetical protein
VQRSGQRNVNADDLKTQLQETRERLLATIAGVTEEQFKKRPPATDADPEPWCIAEVLAHLLAFERVEAERIRLALERDGAEITPRAEDWHESTARAGRLAPVPQLIHGLLASRREIEQLVQRAVGIEDGLSRAVAHPQRGRDTVRWMIEAKVIEHEAEHVLQIEAIKAAVGATAVRA